MGDFVFENPEDTLQSWHIDGYSFKCSWVYPNSWTAIYVPLDNVGTWNVRYAN
ncbi:putative cupredoxin [Rosa chinensis]|uniref:Putative cupredoxin n=1 Tax=Rosa chinensis TaxID=74649 RepID=A0A2P6Q0X3_ROSCH|nr:putative cupredoxin [Rosa chinensis]